MLVEQRRWISEERYLHALNYCMLLPGPEAQQLAIYVGWLLHGTWGGVVAGTLFVLPGFVVIVAISAAYALFADLSIVQGLLFGLQSATLAIVVEAVLRIGRRALKSRLHWGLAAAAFVGIFFFAVPFPAIVLGAAVIGWLFGRDITSAIAAPSAPLPGSPWTHVVRVVMVWGALWLVPVLAIGFALGWQHIYAQQAVFFSKMAVVTFGGAYAVLAYVAQAAVARYHWLGPGEMIQGLALAETTPGPLIMVLAYVGFLGAYRDPGSLPPLWAGVLGATVTTWVTFVPCFLWIFLGAPFIERLRQNQALSAALAGITAAVVGVILNLSLWFAIHVLFRSVSTWQHFGLLVLVPAFGSIKLTAVALSVGAAVMLMRLRWSMLVVLAVCAAAGLAIS
jgi:chromate transporter